MKANSLWRRLATLAVAAALTAMPAAAKTAAGGTFAAGDKTFLLNGEPFVVKAAELHYPRIPRPYWEHRIKMCRALGMNTICMYVFWNIHEQREGEFDFTGQNDIAEFCRIAQKNGMYVIVRPGPYVCAEWEMGGLPWWLLKKRDIRLREQDPYFMERVGVFMKKVGEQLAPLTIQNGGPIIMVQVENEYGSYGEDKAYVGAIRDLVREAGFTDVTLFQCDWASNFTKNGLEDLVWTMNFGTGANIDEQFRRLQELRPQSPLMCSEYWSGWFDKWGARHETRPAEKMVAGIDEMLSKGISFSLYMTHGGTSFGHWAGANSPGFQPDVTSYDYDAPINEYGLPTPKYYRLREAMQKYSDKPLPAVPKPAADTISIPPFALTDHAPIAGGCDSVMQASMPLTFEQMDMGWGTASYSTSLPEIASRSVLTIDEAHDYAQVFIDRQYVGTIDRVQRQRSITLPPVRKGQTLTILVEGMGRINFGRAINDPKGITGSVTLRAEVDGDDVVWTLRDWTCERIPDTYGNAVRALSATTDKDTETASRSADGRGYYRGYFTLKKTGDTFLNMEAFGKGVVYVNGHAIGRYWNIGPQQTLYVPGCWLKKGRNEVVVLDVIGPEGQASCRGQATPVLDRLNISRPATHRKPGDTLDTSTLPLAAEGTFAAGNGWQTVRLDSPKKGRYVAIEGLNAHDGKQFAAIAELYVLDADSKRLSREPWTVKYADSEDVSGGNYMADKVFDLQETTYWLTDRKADYPHVIVIDLGSEQTVTAVEYLPRAEEGAPAGLKDYRIYVY